MVTIEKGNVISVLYKPEKDDMDRGICLWARFYVDLDRYALMIDSDCGSYLYRWVPTPTTEPFLHLLGRMNTSYLLDKISDRSEIDGEATADSIVDYVQEAAAEEGIRLNREEIQEIRKACYHNGSMQELVAEVLDSIEERSFRKALSENMYDLLCCVQKDYPLQAKIIVSIFNNYIRPELRKMETV